MLSGAQSQLQKADGPSTARHVPVHSASCYAYTECRGRGSSLVDGKRETAFLAFWLTAALAQLDYLGSPSIHISMYVRSTVRGN